jgi:oxygen-independent coproporphyrinogen-3 oxidase
VTGLDTAVGVYVHVPFCRTRCRYCDFYRVGENAGRQASFLAALRREIEGLEGFDGWPADTVFLGGGTPSLLAPDDIAGVLALLGRRFALAADAEVTMEANPSDLDPARLEAYRAAGINRLCLGVQSFGDRELRLLGRRHDAGHAARCVAWARAAGFDNLSLDLMLAVPGQTRASFARTLERAIELAPDHLSLYLLEVHERSEMDFLRRERPGLFPGEEEQRRRYLAAAARLGAAGYEHYEISNFSRPGRRSRHNLKYWRCAPFLGLGPAAHSHVGSRRWRHPPDLQAYLADPLAIEELPCEPAAERVFLGLRLAEGLPEGEVEAASGPGLDARLRRLSPFVVRAEGRVRLTREGFVVSNAVLGELVELGDLTAWRATDG